MNTQDIMNLADEYWASGVGEPASGARAALQSAIEALEKDARRWRWWRNHWRVLTRMEVAQVAGLDLSRIHVSSPDLMDAVTDRAMEQK